jgi:hypothetical protein
LNISQRKISRAVEVGLQAGPLFYLLRKPKTERGRNLLLNLIALWPRCHLSSPSALL